MHKLWIIYFGIRYLRLPLWQLLVHDLSKFSYSEFSGYAEKLFAPEGIDQTEKERREKGFAKAWLHHQKCNEHHWQFWVDDLGFASEMPDRFVREMVADWMAANVVYRSFGPADESHKVNHKWLDLNIKTMKLHAFTKNRLRSVLEEVGELNSELNQFLLE